MSNILEYKGYYTRVEYDNVDKVLYGKIEGINDFVNFESSNVENVEIEFHAAVDDYLTYCKEKGIEPDKTYSGKFNVRISKELHKKIVIEAFKEGVSLNQYVERAIGAYANW
ncbi:MAG: type II toxin-antitoxin system HicB family antitoxin [Eubacterium sp.]|nr:type II toxin-antitoxin system HicB family antitoxin [Eubacterium sp.]